MRKEIKNGIRTVEADAGKKIVNRADYDRELAGEMIEVETDEGVFERRVFIASRYTELILGRNDLEENYVEV